MNSKEAIKIIKSQPWPDCDPCFNCPFDMDDDCAGHWSKCIDVKFWAEKYTEGEGDG